MAPFPTPAPDTLAAWQTLLAAIVGGVLAFGGAFAAKFWEHRQQRLALRAAFGAEIDAILKISEIRKHETLAESLLDAWKRGEDAGKRLPASTAATLGSQAICMNSPKLPISAW
jgi:hypothetical protein